MKALHRNRKATALFSALLATFVLAVALGNQLQSANAASKTKLSAAVMDNELLVVLGHGFPAGPVSVSINGKSTVQSTADANGRFAAMAFVSGQSAITVKATGGNVSAIAKARTSGKAVAPTTGAQTPAVQPQSGGGGKPVAGTNGAGIPAGASVPAGGGAAAPAAAGAGQICKNPIKSTSEARGSIDIGTGGYQVRNEAWNDSHGPQTIYACSEQSWYVMSQQTDHGGAVQTYPDSLYALKTPMTTSQLKSVTSTFGEAYQPQGDWNAGYDIWLNDFSKEVMIWNEWHGGPGYWPTQAKTSVNLGGVPYKFMDNGGELMFFRDTQVKSGSVDILAALKWLQTQGKVSASDKLSQIEYGVEICATQGNQRFDNTGFTVNVS